EREKIVPRRVDRAGEADLLLGQVAIAIVDEQLGEDEGAVEGRAQLVRDVREELRLVEAGALELALGLPEVVALLLQRLRLLLELGVHLLELGLLVLETALRLLEGAALLLELLVLQAQLLLARLQLLGLALGLGEELAELAAVPRRAERHPDRLGDSTEELGDVRRDRPEEAELDGAGDHAVGADGSDDEMPRPALAHGRGHREVILGRLD